jgi:hypothetical protein
VQTVQTPDWKGFGIRLGRAIDRWPGGGQKAFTRELASHAERHGLRIPTSYRTLVNYLTRVTRPSVAWVEAAAAVLRWNSEYLLTGEGQEREGDTGEGVQLSFKGGAGPRASLLNRLIVRELADLPMTARLMIFRFVDDYFAEEADGWEVDDLPRRAEDVERALREFFGPLLARPRMRDFEINALVAALTAAAYTRLASAGPLTEGNDNGKA